MHTHQPEDLTSLCLTPDRDTASLALTIARAPISLPHLRPELQLDGITHHATALDEAADGTLTWHFAATGLTLQQRTVPAHGGLLLHNRLRHDGPTAVILNRFTLLGTESAQWGATPPDLRVLVESGYAAEIVTLGERQVNPMPASGEDQAIPPAWAEGTIRSQMFTVAYSRADSLALLAGYTSFRRWVGQVSYRWDGERASWWAHADGGDLPLAPGQEVELESLLLIAGHDPQALLEHYTNIVAVANGITTLAQPPVTWYSWYPHRLGVSEERVLANADLAAQRLVPLGLSTMLLDLGWQDGYLPSVVRENDQFPHGLSWLRDRLGERGLRLGSWFAPYAVSEFDPVATEHPDWLLRGEDGRPKVVFDWFWTPHGAIYALDLTHPEARAHLQRTVESLAERGVTYIKNDFMGSASSAIARGRHDPNVVAGGGVEASRLGSAIIAEAMRGGDPDALVLSGNPHEPAALGLLNLLYTCVDTGNTGFVGWDHLRRCYTSVAVHTVKNRRWGIIQPSCLVIGPPGTLEESRLRATATFLSGGQVDLGDDLTTLPEDRWHVITATLPLLGQSATPVDLWEPVGMFSLDYNGLTSGQAPDTHVAAAKLGPRVWHLPVEHEGQEWHLVALFEYDRPEHVAGSDRISWFRIPRERLGLEPGRRYWAHEFWGQQFLGELPGPRPVGTYSHPGDAAALLLPSDPEHLEAAFHGPAVKLLVIREAKGHPWPVATSFHQSGGVELEGVAWDAASRALSGRLRRPAGQAGSITIAGALPGKPAITVEGRPVVGRAVGHGGLAFDVITADAVTSWRVHW